MDKRYQVFVSSTYTDLKDERQTVIQTLMEMDCIPAGMELFPAADEDQFEFIKKVIDDCDYYLLIIGGRYGSLAEDQISYTEKEFDYAVDKGIKVIALIHKNPADIPAGKSEGTKELQEKLKAFRAKAMTGRMVDFWEDAKDLRGAVSVSLNKSIKMYPAIGWVRADRVASQGILEEINELRKENSELKIKFDHLQSFNNSEVPNLVDFSDCYEFLLKYEIGEPVSEHAWDHEFANTSDKQKSYSLSWKEIFLKMADEFLHGKHESSIKQRFAESLSQDIDIPEGFAITSTLITKTVFDEIKTQLMAYGLIDSISHKSEHTGHSLYLSLTEKGKRVMLENTAITLK